MAKKSPQWLIDRAFNMDIKNEEKVIGTLQILNELRNEKIDYETAVSKIVTNGYCVSKERYERSTQTLYKSYGLIEDKQKISKIGIELAENRITFKEMLLMQLFKKQYDTIQYPVIRPLVVVIKVLLKILEKDSNYAWLDSFDYMNYLTEIKGYEEIDEIVDAIIKSKKDTSLSREVFDVKDSDIWANVFISCGLFEKYRDDYVNSFKLNMNEIELIEYISKNHSKSPLIMENWIDNFSNPKRGLPEILPNIEKKDDNIFQISGFSKDVIKKVINNKLIHGMTQRENDADIFFKNGVYDISNRGFISQAILKSVGLSSKETESKIFYFLKNYSNVLNYYPINLYGNLEEKEIFNRSYWLCSANPKIYDHDAAIKEKGIIDWAQDKHFKKASIGDIVFIYSTSPTKRVKYKCKITKKDIEKENKISDVQYWSNPKQDEDYEGLYIRFELLNKSDDDRLTYDNLLKMGLKSAPQGAMKLDNEYLLLAHYIDAIFEGVDVQELTDEINSFISDFEIKGTAKNLVVFGTPGCGKSYYVNNTLLKDYPNMIDNTKERVVRTTFYQDYTYTDFVGQILPYIEYDVDNENGKKEERVTYKFTPGPFALALKEAVLNRDKEVALVIEELNRGNAPAIFGDIFQLLDRNQEGISEYAITNIHLKDWLNNEIKGANFNKIKIPGNLNIFATMNTSDQNVFTLDTAFKRRWKFEKLSNDFDDYKELYGKEHPFKDDLIPGMLETWKDFVETINDAILNEADITKSEDKQLGIFFVDKNGLVEQGNVDPHDKEKVKEFAYKIFEYLWDDVLKYCRENWFGKEIKSLDDLIKEYIEKADRKQGAEVFVNGIFKENK